MARERFSVVSAIVVIAVFAVGFLVAASFIAAVFAAAIFHFVVLFVLVFHNHSPFINAVNALREKIKRAKLFAYAFKRQVQIDVTLFRFTKGTNFPRFGGNVHISTFAAYP